jgi:hypothetical protein
VTVLPLKETLPPVPAVTVLSEMASPPGSVSFPSKALAAITKARFSITTKPLPLLATGAAGALTGLKQSRGH